MIFNINSVTEKRFPMSLFGYNRKKVDEFLNELMTSYWNLEEENKDLKNDLINCNHTSNITHISNTKWEEKEYSLLLGLTLQEDLLDSNGNVICNKNTIITSQLIENLISKGLYGELVFAADQSKGVVRNAR
jgi:DivIVA domain-containing protein